MQRVADKALAGCVEAGCAEGVFQARPGDLARENQEEPMGQTLARGPVPGHSNRSFLEAERMTGASLRRPDSVRGRLL